MSRAQDIRPDQVILEFYRNFENDNLDKLPDMLSEDFKATGRNMQLDKQGFLQLLRNLKEAIPDLRFNISVDNINEGKIEVSARITGTHRNDLKLLDGDVIRTTNIRLNLPQERWELMVDPRTKKYIHAGVRGSEEGGLSNILHALGAKTKHEQKGEMQRPARAEPVQEQYMTM
eukprot:GILK01011780.1.p2 GENE.GILK01011780.1~~GILK01011780.1.p2  ORF type:complete len:174 (-),score=38.97 GILK01011780.1:178-699(-)